MHLLSILALTEPASCFAFDQMLRFFGIAAIVYAFFKGIHLLTAKPAAPQAQAAAPLAASSPHPATATGTATITGSEDIAPETIAVIAAAVASATGSFRRIVSIKSQSALWEKAGRQSVLTSHKIR